jgi:hypothetical protein
MRKLSILVTIVGLLALVGCGGNGPLAAVTAATSPTGGTTAPASPSSAAPVIDYARANPPAISPGQATQLEWSSQNVVSVTVVNHYSPDIPLFTGAATGSFGVTLDESTSFDIFFKGRDGSQPQRYIHIEVH